MTIMKALERAAEAFERGTGHLLGAIAEMKVARPKTGRRGHPVFVLETGEFFPNIVLAAKSTGLSPTTVYRSAVMGRTVKRAGLTFRFDEDAPTNDTTTTQDETQPVKGTETK